MNLRHSVNLRYADAAVLGESLVKTSVAETYALDLDQVSSYIPRPRRRRDSVADPTCRRSSRAEDQQSSPDIDVPVVLLVLAYPLNGHSLASVGTTTLAFSVCR